MSGAGAPSGARNETLDPTVGIQTTGLRFPCPKNFTGRDVDFEDFAYKFKAYLALSNPSFRDMMRQAQ